MSSARHIDPNRGFKTWHISQIYKGPDPAGNIVPNVDDLVIDYERGFYRVTGVTEGDSIPTFQKFDPTDANEVDDLVNGLSGYQPSVAYKAYFTDNTDNYITFDHRWVIRGSDARYIKVFKGRDTSVTGEVISYYTTGSGDAIFKSPDTLNLDVLNDDATLSRAPQFRTYAELSSEEIITAVVYNMNGLVIGSKSFVVVHSDIFRPLDFTEIYISDISLESKYLDSVDKTLLRMPASIQAPTEDFVARLHYSDGSSSVIPIDGVKCKLLGVSAYVPSNGGTKYPISIVYYPDSSEPAINLDNPSLKHIQSRYYMQPQVVNSDFTFRVYLVPRFDGVGTYEVEYYLADLNRQLALDTPIDPTNITVALLDGEAVSFAPNSGRQQVRIRVDIEKHMEDLGTPSPAFEGFVFEQLMTVEFAPMLLDTVPWYLQYGSDSGEVVGGESIVGLTTGNHSLDLGHFLKDEYGIFNVTDPGVIWVDELYNSLEPIYDPYNDTDGQAPTPDSYRIRYTHSNDGLTTTALRSVGEFTVGGSVYVPPANHDWANGQTVEILWFVDDPATPGQKLNLGVTPLPVFLG